MSQACRVEDSYTTNMATCVVLKDPVTILVTYFSNPDKLTNDLLGHGSIHMMLKNVDVACFVNPGSINIC